MKHFGSMNYHVYTLENDLTPRYRRILLAIFLYSSVIIIVILQKYQ